MDSDLLQEAIDHAKEIARSSNNNASCAEDHARLVAWLMELQFRRLHTPLRCRLGLHKTVSGKRVCGPSYLLTCVLCGGRWYKT